MADDVNAGGRRRAGLVLPLFSCVSSRSWGIGDINDIPTAAAWLRSAGISVLQLLPANEMAPGQQSPYSAISAMAIDPIYVGVDRVEDFEQLGGEAGVLDPSERAALRRARARPRIDYPSVRTLKQRALRRCFDRFVDAEWARGSPRARALQQFMTDEAWWLDEYALFRAIHAQEGERPWTEWPSPLRDREPAAIERARTALERDVLFHAYLQWIAGEQWRAARAAAIGVALYGDLPFTVDGDSADVWMRQDQFRLDVSVGVPADAFSETGQDWGMPMYRWDAIIRDDFGWFRNRARRSAELYDGYRVDHIVGFYRTYGRPRDGSEPFFVPESEPEQRALGEQLLAIFRGAGCEIIAEDLGTVPDFVRESLARLGVPGFRVFRWERRWDDEGQPFRDPEEYPRTSVAASGTHDTEPLVTWWEQAGADEQALVNQLPTVQRLTNGAGLLGADFVPTVRDALLEALYASASDLVLCPVPDLFGWRDRINEPATVHGENWSFRLPWPIDRLDAVPEAAERRQTMRRWSATHGRLRA